MYALKGLKEVNNLVHCLGVPTHCIKSVRRNMIIQQFIDIPIGIEAKSPFSNGVCCCMQLHLPTTRDPIGKIRCFDD